MANQTSSELALFEQQRIRSIEDNGELWFSVVDVIGVLTDSSNHQTYWYVLKKREPQLLTVCKKFKFLAPDGKMRPTDCADTEGVLRIIQSVPSPKAEPFKMWLASLGRKHIEEMANPELGFEHLKEIYKAKGYSDEWIGYRLKSIDIRKQLTEEWKERGIKESSEYAILTSEIAKGTFGLSPSEHSKLKGLGKQELRDHMTNLELIFTALSEETTRQFAINADAQGFGENREIAEKGGRVAGEARRNYEEKAGLKVVSEKNFLKQIEEKTTAKEAEQADDNPPV
jgi:DNA-damage-inducible protein D